MQQACSLLLNICLFKDLNDKFWELLKCNKLFLFVQLGGHFTITVCIFYRFADHWCWATKATGGHTWSTPLQFAYLLNNNIIDPLSCLAYAKNGYYQSINIWLCHLPNIWQILRLACPGTMSSSLPNDTRGHLWASGCNQGCPIQ